MFSNPSQEVSKSNFNFHDPEHIALWKGVFVSSINKVLEQVHPTLTAREDALDCVENLIIQVLGILCMRPSPLTINDVEHRVRTAFPTPLDKWALEESKEALEKYKKKISILVLPVDKTHHTLQREVLQYKIDIQVSVFIVAVLEYISADILKLTGNYIKNIHHMEITCQDIKVAMCADKVLSDMFSHHQHPVDVTEMVPIIVPADPSTYKSAVKDFLHDERQHFRNMNMIIKVFFDEIAKTICVFDIPEFGFMLESLTDVSDFTFKLVTAIEDIFEMSDENQPVLVGRYLEELAEDAEFEVYAQYTREILNTNFPELLISILSSQNALNVLPFAGQGFKEAVKFYLPKLLRYPIWHCQAYFDYMQMMRDLSSDQADIDHFEQLEGLLTPLKSVMAQLIQDLPRREREYGMRLNAAERHALVKEKLQEILRSVDGFDSKYIKTFCTEFLREDSMQALSNSRRISERHLFLFDDMLVICKPKKTPALNGLNAAPAEYKLKDVFYVRKVEIKDRDDTDELKNSFEIIPREQPGIIFSMKTAEDKHNWMADLIMLNTRSMLDRTLNSVLEIEEQRNPLRLPPVHLYPFAEPDSPANIVFEDRNLYSGMVIRGGTLTKLIERLTYHTYTDSIYVRVFLTTYTTFTTSENLLNLLIRRYNVPDAFDALNISKETINLLDSKKREDMKRYKQQYYQPIRFRVMNVLKHWVDDFYYDYFEGSELLRHNLCKFLKSIDDRSMEKWAKCIFAILDRKSKSTHSVRGTVYTHDHPPPPIEYHIQCPETEWTILTIHPVEVARQLTLLHYDMYQAVKVTEMINQCWTKDKKEIQAPNLLTMIRHTTKFALWLEKTVVETSNLEERAAIMTRIIEVMQVLLELNNFNDALSLYTSIGSSNLFRLRFTFQCCSARTMKILSDARAIFGENIEKVRERITASQPPSIPFCGVYLTKIVHVEEGNKNDLAAGIINFTKRRRVTDMITNILRFQDHPYCFTVEPRMRKFLEKLDPFPGIEDTLAFNYLYDQSVIIEPKDAIKPPPRAPRRWPDLNLKSPGIKVRSHSNRTHASNGSPSSISPTSPQIPEDQNASSAFRPIYFGTDAPPGGIENGQDELPPLPPRTGRVSRSQSPLAENAPTSSSPPPLPPRSLHTGDMSIFKFSNDLTADWTSTPIPQIVLNSTTLLLPSSPLPSLSPVASRSTSPSSPIAVPMMLHPTTTHGIPAQTSSGNTDICCKLDSKLEFPTTNKTHVSTSSPSMTSTSSSDAAKFPSASSPPFDNLTSFFANPTTTWDCATTFNLMSPVNTPNIRLQSPLPSGAAADIAVLSTTSLVNSTTSSWTSVLSCSDILTAADNMVSPSAANVAASPLSPTSTATNSITNYTTLSWASPANSTSSIGGCTDTAMINRITTSTYATNYTTLSWASPANSTATTELPPHSTSITATTSVSSFKKNNLPTYTSNWVASCLSAQNLTIPNKSAVSALSSSTSAISSAIIQNDFTAKLPPPPPPPPTPLMPAPVCSIKKIGTSPSMLAVPAAIKKNDPTLASSKLKSSSTHSKVVNFKVPLIPPRNGHGGQLKFPSPTKPLEFNFRSLSLTNSSECIFEDVDLPTPLLPEPIRPEYYDKTDEEGYEVPYPQTAEPDTIWSTVYLPCRQYMEKPMYNKPPSEKFEPIENITVKRPYMYKFHPEPCPQKNRCNLMNGSHQLLTVDQKKRLASSSRNGSYYRNVGNGIISGALYANTVPQSNSNMTSNSGVSYAGNGNNNQLISDNEDENDDSIYSEIDIPKNNVSGTAYENTVGFLYKLTDFPEVTKIKENIPSYSTSSVNVEVPFNPNGRNKDRWMHFKWKKKVRPLPVPPDPESPRKTFNVRVLKNSVFQFKKSKGNNKKKKKNNTTKS